MSHRDKTEDIVRNKPMYENGELQKFLFRFTSDKTTSKTVKRHICGGEGKLSCIEKREVAQYLNNKTK